MDHWGEFYWNTFFANFDEAFYDKIGALNGKNEQS
jgi:hypothetical protein